MAGESQQEPKTGAPDPTVLTTEQMLLAIKNLEKLVKAWRGTDQATCIEKFESIATQLRLIETQRVEQKQDTKAAVDAALAAAKEAVKEQTTASQLATGKTETSFAEQLKQQESKFTLALAGVTTSLNDTKDRVARIETLKAGSAETRQDQRLNLGALVGVGSLMVAFLSIAVAVIIATR